MAANKTNPLDVVKHGIEAAQPNRYRWWHGVLFGMVVNGISGISAGQRSQDREYYENLNQAPFAPPGWVFGPAWGINNVSVLWGNLRLLNERGDVPARRPLLWLQGASWVLYSTFSYVYFVKRSPILALVWTSSFYVITIASVLLSLRIDRKIALSFVTLMLWLTLATPVAAYQVLHNPDPLFKTPAVRNAKG